MDIKQLREQCDQLFSKRSSLMSLWQEISDNFYPERGQFTLTHQPGIEFASHLSTSYPLIVRRELGDQIGMMLRPTNKPWFHMKTKDPGRSNHEVQQWMEHFENVQRGAIYDRISQFSIASKIVDHDFAAFGQAVMQIRPNMKERALLYRAHHVKDVAWLEDDEGRIFLVAVRLDKTNRDLMRIFGDKNHQTVVQNASKKPFDTVKCYHIMTTADMYSGDAKGKPWVSIYYDIDHNHTLEEMPTWNKEYVIPRWQRVSGSQYAYSPATIVGLPDGRLIQAMSHTLLKAGEKLVDPPMVGTQDAIKSDVSIYAGGITWVDKEYDERLGEALRPMNINANGMPLGLDMLQDARALLKEAFFLNKLSLPERVAEMTAYEIGQRVQEYIRGALPIFEPMEDERNGQECELTFEILMRMGAFGPLDKMPKALQGADIGFSFESPLHDAIEEQKGHKFVEMKGLILEAMALDQQSVALPDVSTALRDALSGIKVPANWIRSQTTVDQMLQAQEALRESQAIMGQMQQGADIAQTLGIQADEAA